MPLLLQMPLLPRESQMPRNIANNCESREIAKVAIATKNSRCREESRFFCSVPPKAKTIIANPTRKKSGSWFSWSWTWQRQAWRWACTLGIWICMCVECSHERVEESRVASSSLNWLKQFEFTRWFSVFWSGVFRHSGMQVYFRRNIYILKWLFAV